MQVVAPYKQSYRWSAARHTGYPSGILKAFSRPIPYRCSVSPRRCPRFVNPDGLITSAAQFHALSTSQSVKCLSTSGDLKESPTDASPLNWKRVMKVTAIAALSGACLWLLALSNIGVAFQSSVMSSWLGQSGFVAALSLIFLSEIGDKTFFICAILAMRLGRWMAFTGTVLALSFMTVFSVGLGVAFNAIPDAMRTSIPIGKYLSIALLFFFGVLSIWNGMQSTTVSESSDELADAEETVAQSEELKSQEPSEDKGRLGLNLRGRLKSVAVVTALIFVAEWGDRSMLTTIALGASQNPLGVALGGIVGHTAAALIAIAGGSMISKVISENSVHFISGIFFIIFAAATALNWM